MSAVEARFALTRQEYVRAARRRVLRSRRLRVVAAVTLVLIAVGITLLVIWYHTAIDVRNPNLALGGLLLTFIGLLSVHSLVRVVLLSPLRQWRIAKRRGVAEVRSVNVSEDGFELRTENAETQWKWAACVAAREWKDAYELRFEHGSHLTIPKRALSTPADGAALRGLIDRKTTARLREM